MALPRVSVSRSSSQEKIRSAPSWTRPAAVRPYSCRVPSGRVASQWPWNELRVEGSEFEATKRAVAEAVKEAGHG